MKRATKYGLCLLVVSALFGALPIRGFITQVPTGTWTAAGNGSTAMSSPRAVAATVLLQDGSILITGGDSGAGAVASVDIFDTSGNFSSATVMNFGRSQHTAVVLQDGRVLVAGGIGAGGTLTDTAEIYDPAANTWTPAGPLMVPRSGHTASLLQDGTVLIAGGNSVAGVANTLEIFSPTANTFTSTAGVLPSPRQNHAAAVLQDGRVIIVGGSDGTSALATSDIYDPATGHVSVGPSMSTPRQGLTATTQLDGKVAVIGGGTVDGGGSSVDLASAEVYDPTQGTFALTGSLTTARQGHQAFLLPHNGGILVVGGTSGGAAVSSAELYYPWTGAFNATGPMASAGSSATGSPLSNGTPDSQNDGLLLVAGGKDASGAAQQCAELYGFAWVKTDKADYAPGDLVTITGGGWKPGEIVRLSLLEAPFIDQPNPMDVTADQNGNISDAEWAPDQQDVGIKFYLTATGSASQAQTTFTDSVTSVTITSPTTASLVTLTSLPANLDVHFNYVTSSTGTTTGQADVLGTSVTGQKSLTPGTGSDFITVTIPAGTANGSYNVKVTVTNSTAGGANNKNDNQNGAVVINVPSDTTPPLVTVTFTPNGSNGWFTSPSASGTISASDVSTGGSNMSTIRCTVDTVATTLTGLTGIGTPSASGTLTVTGDGAHNISCTATDSANNTSAASTATVKIDSLAPNGSIDINSGALYTSSTSVTLNLTCGDGTGSGCAQMAFSNDGVTFGSFVTFATSTSYALPTGDGVKTVYVEFKDSAGNLSIAYSHNITLDTAAPTGSIVINGGDAATNSTSVTLTLTCSDLGSGCDQMQFSNDNSTYTSFETFAASKAYTLPSGDGNKTVYVKFKDKAGNVSSPYSDSILLDTVPPVTTITLAPASPDGAAGWYISNVHVTVSATDTDGSGVAETRCVLDPGTPPANFDAIPPGCAYTSGADVASDGHHNLYAASRDKAGNKEGVKSSTFQIDKTPPTSTVTLNPSAPNGENGWYKTNVHVTVAATDNTDGSGVAETRCVLDGSAPSNFEAIAPGCLYAGSGLDVSDGIHNLYVASKDKAGNKEAVRITSFQVDTTPPTITLSTRLPAANAFGWNNASVTVTWSCSDTLSGPVSPTVNQTVSTEGTNQSATGTCKDYAGNTASDTQTGINIDETKPKATTSTPVNGTNYVLHQSVTPAYSCTDDRSGLPPSGALSVSGPPATAGCSGPATVDTSTVGPKTYTVTATDEAGNQYTQTVSYNVQYNFIGFLPPVDNPPVVNTGKSGRTYPVKWQLTDAIGNYVSNLSSVASLKYGGVSCGVFSGDPADPIDTTATGGTSLRYDSTANQFTYNWATSAGSACYVLVLTLDDGTVHNAYFSLK